MRISILDAVDDVISRRAISSGTVRHHRLSKEHRRNSASYFLRKLMQRERQLLFAGGFQGPYKKRIFSVLNLLQASVFVWRLDECDSLFHIEWPMKHRIPFWESRYIRRLDRATSRLARQRLTSVHRSTSTNRELPNMLSLDVHNGTLRGIQCWLLQPSLLGCIF